MAIRNGDLADADSLLNNVVGTQFRNFSNILYNSAYIGFNSKLNVATGVPNLKNIKYDVFNSDTMTKSGMEWNSTNKYYITPSEWEESDYTVYDDCDNSSIDGTKWSTASSGSGSVAESTYLQVNSGKRGSSTATSLAIDMTSNFALMINLPKIYQFSNNDSYGYANATLSFGGVNIFNYNNIAGNIDLTNSKLWILKLNGLYFYRRYDNSSWGSWTVFSPTTSVLVISAGSYDSGNHNPNSYIRVNNIRYNTLATSLSTGCTIISPTTSVSATDAIATVNTYLESGSSVEIYLSSDGTNYEEVSDATIHRFTDLGGSLKTKILVKGRGIVSEYAVLYNITGEE